MKGNGIINFPEFTIKFKRMQFLYDILKIQMAITVLGRNLQKSIKNQEEERKEMQAQSQMKWVCQEIKRCQD